MTHVTGLSYSTVQTVWNSSTSFLIVDVYTLSRIAGGELTAVFSSQEWWAFENTATTSSGSVTLAPTGVSTQGPTVSMSSGLSHRTVAGISIAVALVGGILGVVIGFMLARRSKRYRSLPEYVAYPDKEKEFTPTSTARCLLQLDQSLLGSTPDAIIACDLGSLGRLIQQHTKTHYHIRLVQLESSRLRQSLRDLGIERDNESAIEKLASLALDPRTRLNAIRHVIAKATFESTVIGGSTCVSLLPPLVSSLSLAMSPIEDDIGSNEATKFAITRWRQLSAFLLHPNRSQRTPLIPSEDTSTQEALKLTVSLNRFLEPFISEDREDRYEQENHLREVIAECATFGYVLLSQPYEYRFQFGSEGELNTIIVCPGLEKVTDEKGHRNQPPVPQIVAPVVESI